MEAITHIFDELNGMEESLVASKIADRVGITRSVIVNALRKFESAGVIESRSSGMKGTYIKVLNDAVFDEIEELEASERQKLNEKCKNLQRIRKFGKRLLRKIVFSLYLFCVSLFYYCVLSKYFIIK